MNIKNFLGNLSPITQVNSGVKVERQIKTDDTQERDANGQEQYQKQQKKKEKMSEEQFDKAIALLREKHFVKDMHWVVLAVMDNDLKYALIQDSNGKEIRRISEYDLWEIFEDQSTDQTKGQLLKKTA